MGEGIAPLLTERFGYGRFSAVATGAFDLHGQGFLSVAGEYRLCRIG
jgi:predicted N-acetyltransferase YhbS